MKDAPPEFVFECPAEELSAYIDGELEAEHELALEWHIGGCDVCRNALNEQKEFLLALTDTLEREIPMELPVNFTRSVVVNAESKVSGLRDRRARSSAVIVISVLLLLAILAVGSVTGTFSPAFSLIGKLLALGGMILQVISDLVSAAFSLLRSIFNSQTFGTPFAYIALSLAIVLLIYFGSRSLKRYFRTPGA